jgi:hypothetical protein
VKDANSVDGISHGFHTYTYTQRREECRAWENNKGFGVSGRSHRLTLISGREAHGGIEGEGGAERENE